METRRIGSLNATIVGIGCNNFGGRIDFEATRRVVDAALEVGINFFDTADIYGGTKSEEYLGQALKGRRDQAIIATKFGHKIADDKFGAKANYIREAVEDSLRRLNIETIDLYQLHTPDESTPISETVGALQDLVSAGKIREFGCSNFSVDQLREAEAAAGDGAKFVSVQNEYSLFHRAPESGVLEECVRQHQGFLPYFPLASGLLTGKYRKGQPKPEGTRLASEENYNRFANDTRIDAIETLTQYAESHGRSLLELAFGWLLAKPSIASVIAGATRPEQVLANANASNWQLTNQEVSEVDALVAGVS
jgi:aryl-alcohol dehydrogenase-like predicted oxidoreductase